MSIASYMYVYNMTWCQNCLCIKLLKGAAKKRYFFLEKIPFFEALKNLENNMALFLYD